MSALVPVNLYPETEVIGPTSLDAVSFITLGIPLSSDVGSVTVESFTLVEGWLTEQSGLTVAFLTEEGFPTNAYGVSTSNVLIAADCSEEGECSPGTYGGFCVDQDGYLVSVGALSTSHIPPQALPAPSFRLCFELLRFVS
jgi:hypothetical protein